MPNKALKILGIAAAGGAAIVISIQAYATITGNEDLNIYRRIKEQLTAVKNEPNGCCLPLCGESGETMCSQSVGSGYQWINSPCDALDECELVCCYPHGEMPKASCEHLGVTNYTEGECEAGYTAKTHGTKTWTNEYGTKMTWVSKLDAYTCDQDPNNAKWHGDYDWDWRTVDAKGHKGFDDLEESVVFTVNDGDGTFLLAGKQTVKVNVSTDTMTVTYSTKPLGTIKSEGPVTKGHSKCKNK